MSTPLIDLIGRTFSEVFVSQEKEELVFKSTDGWTFTFYHEQDCCESVLIEDICGDLSDLVGSPILDAREDTSEEPPSPDFKPSDESFLWTFYNFATKKGHVTVRWYGESNGYYSVSVYLRKGRTGEGASK